MFQEKVIKEERRKNTVHVKFHHDHTHRNFDCTHRFSTLLSMENLLYSIAIRDSKRASRIVQFTDVYGQTLNVFIDGLAQQ